MVPVLDHACCNPRCECLGSFMKVAQNCIAVSPDHKADRVCVDMGHEEGHGPAGSHQNSADVFRCEPYLGADDLGCGAEC